MNISALTSACPGFVITIAGARSGAIKIRSTPKRDVDEDAPVKHVGFCRIAGTISSRTYVSITVLSSGIRFLPLAFAVLTAGFAPKFLDSAGGVALAGS